MKITIDRAWKKEGYTVSRLFIDGKRICDALEDKDRCLNQGMTLEYIKARKVYGQTAIPSGTYRITLTHSSKFASRAWGKKYHGLVPLINGVKAFDGVRIHPANSAKDVEGCIAVGKNTEVGKVTNSTYWYYKIMDSYIMPAWKRGERIEIEIK